MALTIKQENFCQLVVEFGDNSKAYRGAYDASRMKPESVHRKARELIENVKVAARIDELREELAKRGRCTLDSLLLELEETRVSALNRETPQCGAAVAATMGKAKLCGLDKQLVELSGGVDVTVRSKAEMFKDLYGED